MEKWSSAKVDVKSQEFSAMETAVPLGLTERQQVQLALRQSVAVACGNAKRAAEDSDSSSGLESLSDSDSDGSSAGGSTSSGLESLSSDSDSDGEDEAVEREQDQAPGSQAGVGRDSDGLESFTDDDDDDDDEGEDDRDYDGEDDDNDDDDNDGGGDGGGGGGASAASECGAGRYSGGKQYVSYGAGIRLPCTGHGASKLMGVSWQKNRKRWMARYSRHRSKSAPKSKHINLGAFHEAKHAGLAWDAEARRHGRTLTQLNFPDEEPSDWQIANWKVLRYKNFKKHGRSTSKFRGVCICTNDTKGRAVYCVQVNIKEVKRRMGWKKPGPARIGNYRDEVAAALAFDSVCRQWGVDEAELNFPIAPHLPVPLDSESGQEGRFDPRSEPARMKYGRTSVSLETPPLYAIEAFVSRPSEQTLEVKWIGDAATTVQSVDELQEDIGDDEEFERMLHLLDRRGESTPRSDSAHDDLCMSCNDGGNLICCDTCPCVAHIECVGLDVTPSTNWFCAICLQRRPASRKRRPGGPDKDLEAEPPIDGGRAKRTGKPKNTGQEARSCNRRPIEEVSLESGKVIKTFPSTRAASASAGLAFNGGFGLRSMDQCVEVKGRFWRYRGSSAAPVRATTIGKAVEQLCPKSGTVTKRFSSIAEAARACGIRAPNVSAVCNGASRQHTAAGFKWRFADGGGKESEGGPAPRHQPIDRASAAGEECREECPICLAEDMDRPAAAICGHVFCHGCISSWIANDASCPTCRRILAGEDADLILEEGSDAKGEPFRAVEQMCTRSGNLMRVYPSAAAAAARVAGTLPCHILEVCRNAKRGAKSAAGYAWRFRGSDMRTQRIGDPCY